MFPNRLMTRKVWTEIPRPEVGAETEAEAEKIYAAVVAEAAS